MQAGRFQMFDDNAAVPVHDSLGTPRCSRTEEHPQRMIEPDPHRDVGVGNVGLRLRIRRNGALVAQNFDVARGLSRRISDDDVGAQPFEKACQFRTVGRLVDFLAVVSVAVGGHQHLGLELGESARGTRRRVVLSATRPDRADRGGAEERHQRLGNVGQVGGDHIADTDPEPAQRARERQRLLAQLCPRQRHTRAALVDSDDRGPRGGVGIVGVPEDLIDVVQGDVGKPLRARHFRRREDRGIAFGERTGNGVEVEEVPHRAPELRRTVHRPRPQRLVRRRVDAVALGDLSREIVHARCCFASARRSGVGHHANPRRSTDSARIATLRTLPVTVIGNSLTTWTYLGILWRAIFPVANSRTSSAVRSATPSRN